MWLLVVGHINGSVDYYGPFPSLDRAIKYANAGEDFKKSRWHAVPLVIPYSVVSSVYWRDQNAQ